MITPRTIAVSLTRIHTTAIVETDVELGPGTVIWDNVHIRHSTNIGEQCIIGEKSYIGYDVRIGNRVKINAFVYICTAVTVEDGVMIGAHSVFTNDRFPRATTPDLRQLRTSAPDENTLPTTVREGASIGAGCTIGSDLVIGRFAMVGMGSVVTKSVPDFGFVVGNPARCIGYVCRCGRPVVRCDNAVLPKSTELQCGCCGLLYSVNQGSFDELFSPSANREPLVTK
jgi:UDP-2-acetamido-3-amino-2,3-dideoxy-glucuronate N-acetyltransferase